MADETGSRLVAALQDPACYDHPTEAFEVHETHASWVILTGPYAYKLKKPVNYGFLDFTTLELRRFYCEEELRLNRRLAPELYHAVVPVTGTAAQPRMNGPGEAIEYAVQMTQFDNAQRLDRALGAGAVRVDHIDDLAAEVARFHQTAPVAGVETEYGLPERIQQTVTDNFRDLAPYLDSGELERLEQLREWSEASYQALHEHLRARRENGWVRECHGDLHLANMLIHEDRVRAFDCVEFNPNLRWIDTASEAAFLVMDLEHHGRSDWAARWRSLYLEWLGDYDAVALLPYYQAYRAMVRAKVTALTAGQSGPGNGERTRRLQEVTELIQLAHAYQGRRDPRVIITHGVSGSGKSTVGLGLLEQLRALRIRSDVERKRLFGMDPLAEAESGPGEGIYRHEATRKTYQRLAQLARKLLACGEPVLVDATFLERDMRDLLRHVAALEEVPFTILHTTAGRDVLAERVRQRQAAGRDASDANVGVLEAQFGAMEALESDEKPYALEVDTAEPVDYADLAQRLRSQARIPSE